MTLCDTNNQAEVLPPARLITVRTGKPIIDQLIADMVYVEGGTFQMGATPEQGDHVLPNEKPVHQVTLDGFFIGKTPVTQAQWEAVMGSGTARYPDRPVVTSQWEPFVKKLNVLTGLNFTLPTEAQWEFAARGGIKSKGFKYAGSNDPDEVAWFSENSGRAIHPVGQKKPNELGLYDMSGNVYEWCTSSRGQYTSDEVTNPKPACGSDPRGGCCSFDAFFARVSSRWYNVKRLGFGYVGFRLSCTPPTEMYVDTEILSNQEQTELTSPAFEKTFKTTNVGGNPIIDQLITDMVYVQGGSFQVGTMPEQGDEPQDDENPVHQVALDGFFIGKTPVTQAQWEAIMGSNPASFKGDIYRPVEQVSWDDCQEFIQKLNAQTGLRFALPTEAQWEFAARGGVSREGFKYAGSNNRSLVSNKIRITYAVGQKKPNELGLYDMSGNVSEWCADWYGNFSSDTSGKKRRDMWSKFFSNNSLDEKYNPTGPDSGVERVIRGGSWNCHDDSELTVDKRSSCDPTSRYDYIGFRLVLHL